MHLALNKTHICNASSSQVISNGNNKCRHCIKTLEHTPEGTEFWTEKLPSKYLCANQLHVSQTCQLHPHSILNKQEPEKDVSKSWNIVSKSKSWNTSFNNAQIRTCNKLIMSDLLNLINNWPSHGKEGNDIFIWIGRVSPRFRSTDICRQYQLVKDSWYRYWHRSTQWK